MDLERLIAVEERNEALIAEARREAERIVAAATASAEARRAAMREEVARGIAAMEREMAAERTERLAALEAEAARGVARFGGVSDQQIQAIVPELLARLMAEEGA